MTASSHTHGDANGHTHSNGDATHDGVDNDHDDLRLFLEAHFGDVAYHKDQGTDDELTMSVEVDGSTAQLDLITMVSPCDVYGCRHDAQRVASESAELRERVERVVEMALATMRPLSLAFVGQGLDTVKGEDVVMAA